MAAMAAAVADQQASDRQPKKRRLTDSADHA
eukprot:SAG31_NODE_44516_length_262_cov_0.950920_1_plen_30_part_10